MSNFFLLSLQVNYLITNKDFATECYLCQKNVDMPINKNAFIRYKYLDKLLSDYHHYYDIHDLTDKVNAILNDNGFSQVGQRCIEKDLDVLGSTPFDAPIEHIRLNGKNVIRYRVRYFSIFKKEMREEEANLLREVLSAIGQFEGLDNFSWLDGFKQGYRYKEMPKVISFSCNPYLQNSNMLGKLFDYISNKVVICLSYHTFTDETSRSIVFHPYLLKQYNDRWYLLGAADSDKAILHFALDRIDEVKSMPEKKYIECPEDLSERFDDIVGVTLYKDRDIQHILCWVSDRSKGYVDTKPIHGSYTPIKGDKDSQLRNEFPQLQGGVFFTLDCISNYELIRELCSYGKDLLVLRSDGSVAADVRKRVAEMAEQYRKNENNK